MRRLLVPLACIALLSACSPSDEPTPSPTTSAVEPSPVQSPTPLSSPTPTPTPSPTPTTFPSYPADLPTEDPETAAIIKGWQEYWRVYEKFAADPLGSKDLTETQYVTTGEEATLILDKLAALREERLRVQGGVVFRAVEVEKGLSSSEPRTAQLSYCLDRSHMQIMKIDSDERVPAEGTLAETALLVLMPDGSWRVSQITNEIKTC